MSDLPGLPAAAFGRWFAANLPDVAGDSWTAEVIAGGLSNVTYRVRSGERVVVVRRPPLGGVLPSAHDMAREYRVLSALAGSAVPVPEPLAFCADEEVLGAPFYVMAEVPGVVLRTAEDTARLSEAQRRELSLRLVGTLAAIHGVDIAAAGLEDFGRPAGFTERQVRRWGRQWELTRTRELPGMESLRALLAEQVPEQAGSALVHGDYRLDNTILQIGGDDLRDDLRIAAVVDWELSSLGDPMADLGLALTYWADAGDEQRAAVPVAPGVTAHPGFLTSDEVAARYAELTGADLGELAYYRAFGAFKLAVILEGVNARHAGGHTVGDGYAGVGEAVPVLVERGLGYFSTGGTA